MGTVAEKTKSNEKEHMKNIDINNPEATTATSCIEKDNRLKELVQLAENIINELSKNDVTVSEANFILDKTRRLIGKFYSSVWLVPPLRNQEVNLSEPA